MKHPSGNGKVLYLDCINVSFLVVMLCYSVARCSQRGKLGDGYMGSLPYFLQLHEKLLS